MQPQWRTVCRFPKKLKIEATYDPAIPPLGIYPEKAKKKRYIYIYTHNGILSSHKNNAILSPAATWIDSENIIQNRNRLTTRKQLTATKRGRERGKEKIKNKG